MVKKYFSAKEKSDLKKHYETQDPKNIKPYKKSAKGKAAHKRARKQKTSTTKRGG